MYGRSSTFIMRLNNKHIPNFSQYLKQIIEPSSPLCTLHLLPSTPDKAALVLYIATRPWTNSSNSSGDCLVSLGALIHRQKHPRTGYSSARQVVQIVQFYAVQSSYSCLSRVLWTVSQPKLDHPRRFFGRPFKFGLLSIASVPTGCD